MISYDSYQNRIKKVAAVKNFIVRFRALFISLFALLIGLSLALIFAKGMITQKLVLPDRIIYGDNYADSIQPPKAFLSDVDYQFKRIGEPQNTKSAAKYALTDDETAEESEWSYELPTFAGKYLVRMVSNKIFGKSYSEPKEFEIETFATEFIIESDTVVYGEMPENYTFKLTNGDTLIVENVVFDYDKPAENITDICANASSFTILNKKGEDVTFCYNISVQKKEGVEILPQSVTITPASLEAVYSGTAIDYDKTVYKLKGGEAHVKLQIFDSAGNLLDGNPVNAGTYTIQIVPDETTVISGETDVTKHYNITYASSTITVNKRPVTIATQSDAKEYDGTPFVRNEVEADGLIEDLHTLETVFREDIIEAGIYRNSCSYSILDKDGNDVTPNYEIATEVGTLEIKVRTITVTTSDNEKVYDGTPFDATRYSIDKTEGEALVSGHTAIPTYNYFDYKVGSYKNDISFKIEDNEGVDKSSNYAIEYEYGTLEISKREISVTSEDGSWIYDGEVHFKAEIEAMDEGTLADGEEIAVIEWANVQYFTEEPIENVIACAISNGYEDTTENYEITYKTGTLAITPREITVTNPTIEKPYDGKPLLGTDGTPETDGLVWGDVLVADEIANIIDVGEKANNTTYTIENADGKDITDSYKIVPVDGTISVTKADLTIYTATVEKVYDGTPLTGDDVSLGTPDFVGIAAGERGEPFNVAQRIEYGPETVYNTTEYKIFAERALVVVETTGNYEISYSYGTLTINKRFIRIETETAYKEYDGTPLSAAEGWEALPDPGAAEPGVDVPDDIAPPPQFEDEFYWPVSAYADLWYGKIYLLSNHTLKVDESATPTQVTNVNEGRVENKVQFIIVDENGADKTHNYDLNIYCGMLWITPRNLLITTSSSTWTYDGTEYYDDTYKEVVHVNKNGEKDEADTRTLVKNSHELVALDYTRVTEFTDGKITNKVDFVVESSEEDARDNYKISYTEGEFAGKLEILKRPVTITTADDKKEYDGAPLSHTGDWKDEGGVDYKGNKLGWGLVQGHDLRVKYDGQNLLATSITNVKWQNGEVVGVENEVDYDVYSGDRDVSHNYDITYSYGKLTVTQREIGIKTFTSSKEFDGEEYSDSRYELLNGTTLVDQHKLIAETYAKVTFVTENEVENKVTYRVEKDGENLTDNYKIVYKEYGYISRTVRYVQITTHSGEWTYDGTAHAQTEYDNVHLIDVRIENGKLAEGRQDTAANVKGLVLGHKLSVVTSTNITNVWESNTQNTVSYIVENDNINKNYFLHVVYGELNILPRPITIITATKKHVYDDEEFSWSGDWKVEGGIDYDGKKLDWGLLDSHTLAVVEIKTKIRNVSWNDAKDEFLGTKNDVVYKVVYKNNTEDDEPDENYKIGYEYGTLTITPRPITVTIKSEHKTYDGTPLECRAFDCDPYNKEGEFGLLTNKNHAIDIDGDVPSITYITLDVKGNEVNTKTNTFKCMITSGGTPVTDNYAITYIDGTLTIDKLAITITTPDGSWNYDGQWHYGDNSKDIIDATVFDTLVGGEIARAVDASISKIIDYFTNPDGIENETKYQIFTSDGKVETTYCYQIGYTNGTLKINKIDLTITTLSHTKVYDGELLSGASEKHGDGDKVYIAPIFDGKVEGETYKAYEVTEFTDVATKQNATKYYIFADRGGDEPYETTGNYNISYIKGALEVEKRPITVLTNTDSHEYDGQEFTCPEGWTIISPLKLVEDHTLKEYEIIGRLTEVRRDENKNVIGIPNTVKYNVLDKAGRNVSPNYDISYVDGEITVTPRNLLITTKSNSWVYDANEHSENTYEKIVHIKDGIEDKEDTLTLIGNHVPVAIESTVTVVENFTDGKVVNAVKFIIKSGTVDVTGNYNLTYTEGDRAGTLEITKRPVTVTTLDGSDVYNSRQFTWTKFEVEEFNKSEQRGIVSVHEARLDTNKAIAFVTYVHEGEVENRFSVYIAYKNGGSDTTEDGFYLTDNYQLDGNYKYGKIFITPYEITVTNPTRSRPYDSTLLCGDDIDIFTGLLFEGDMCAAAEITKILDFGTTPNKTTYKIYNANEPDITDSYKINYTEGATLTITKATLNITTATLEKVYDGTPLYGDIRLNGTETEERIALQKEGLFAGEEIEPDKDETANRVPVAENVENYTHYKVFADRNGEWTDISANYKIDYEYGTLTVKVRPIMIQTASFGREFDGNPLSLPEGKVIVVDNYYVLADGHRIVVEDEFDAPSVTYVTDGDDRNGIVKNILKFSVYGADGKPVTENYKIDYDCGTLQIIPRNILVTTNANRWEYSGKPHSDSEPMRDEHIINLRFDDEGNLIDYTFDLKAGIIAGHRFVVNSIVPEITNVGSCQNFINYVIKDSGENDVSANYNINYVYGMLEIIPHDVYIELQSFKSLTYGDKFDEYPTTEDGKYVFAYLNNSGPVNNEEIVISIMYLFGEKVVTDITKLNAGAYKVVLDLDNTVVVGGNASLANYDIHVSASEFTVSPKAISIDLLFYDGIEERTYNGSRYGFDLENGFETDGLVYGDKLTIAVKYILDGQYFDRNPLNAGKYTIVFDNDNCLVNDDADLAKNYIITCTNTLTYTINKFELRYQAQAIEHVYSGTEFNLSDDVYEGLRLALVNSDTLTDTTIETTLDGKTVKAINAYTYMYKITGFVVYNLSEDEDVTDSYILAETARSAAYKISQRKISLSVSFGDKADTEFTGKDIDLVKLYPDYGPFTSAPIRNDVGYYGIYEEDLKKLDPEFTYVQGGDKVPLINYGRYEVSVELNDKKGFDVRSNYDITEYNSDYFEITLRQIVVIPKKVVSKMEYDGTSFNDISDDYFDYDTRHYLCEDGDEDNGEGFRYGDEDKAQYTVIYTLKDTEGNTVSKDLPLQAGGYYLDIELDLDTMYTANYYIVEYENPVFFEVQKRRIYVDTPDDPIEHVYNKSIVEAPEGYTTYYEDYTWKNSGFVNDDEDYAIPVYGFYKDSECYDFAIDAGTYVIKIIKFTGVNTVGVDLERNYEVLLYEVTAFDYGRIIINPAILIVTPREYNTLEFDGSRETLTLPSNYYNIQYLEGGSDGLFSNKELGLYDDLRFTARGSVDIKKTYYTYVTFTDITIYERGAEVETERDVTANYNIAYNYSAYDALYKDHAELPKLTREAFMAELSFVRRELKILQPEAPEGYQEILYGTSLSIPVRGQRISTDSILLNNLLPGHRVEIYAAAVTASYAQDIENWITLCKVYNGEGTSEDYTMAYNITFDCPENTHIKLKKRDLPVKISADFSIDGHPEGYELKPGEYTVDDGLLILSATIKVVVENGQLVAKISNRLDGEKCVEGYDVHFVYETKENNLKEAEYASRIQLLLSRRVAVVKKDDISE